MDIQWFDSQKISPEHLEIPIKQIYIWVVTSDKKIPIVASQNGGFQFPGGKPEEGETKLETIKRELSEETGIVLESLLSEPKLFGYYFIENDPNWPNLPKFLQLRYYLFTKKHSAEIKLFNNEKEEEEVKMIEVKWGNVLNLSKDIPWMIDSEEYTTLLSILSSRNS